MAAVAAVTNVLWGCSVNFSWQIPQCGVRANLCIDVVQSLFTNQKCHNKKLSHLQKGLK